MLYMEIFNRSYLKRYPIRGLSIPRHLDYLRRTYDYNKELVVRYYKERNFSVKNNHILSRYSQHLPVMLDADPFTFISASEDRVTSLARLFEFTSSITKGISHPPHFYGNGGSELILSKEEYVSPNLVIPNWKDYSCIRAITHQRNDMSMLLPFGHDDGAKGGLATIELDGVALNLMYREFQREQKYKLESGQQGPIIGKNTFMTKYVIPGIIESHLDHCLLNRIIDTYYGNEIITPKYTIRVPSREPMTQLDIFVKDVIDNITRKDMDFVNILANIPLLFHGSALDLLSFDMLPATRQSNWLFLSSRIKYMAFLIDVAKSTRSSRNFIEDWKRLVKRMERDSNIRNEFSYDINKSIMDSIEKIKRA